MIVFEANAFRKYKNLHFIIISGFITFNISHAKDFYILGIKLGRPPTVISDQYKQLWTGLLLKIDQFSSLVFKSNSMWLQRYIYSTQRINYCNLTNITSWYCLWKYCFLTNLGALFYFVECVSKEDNWIFIPINN